MPRVLPVGLPSIKPRGNKMANGYSGKCQTFSSESRNRISQIYPETTFCPNDQFFLHTCSHALIFVKNVNFICENALLD